MLFRSFSLFGAQLATTTQIASTPQWESSLAGTSVSVRDSAGVSRAAEVYLASPSQVGYRVPPETQPGFATVTINAGGVATTGAINVATAYPNAFRLTTDGLAHAYATRRRNGLERPESIVVSGVVSWSPLPIDPGPAGDDVFLNV